MQKLDGENLRRNWGMDDNGEAIVVETDESKYFMCVTVVELFYNCLYKHSCWSEYQNWIQQVAVAYQLRCARWLS